jgi:hypothetical protein
MRDLFLLMTGICLTSCAGDLPHTVTFRSPVNGATELCSAGLLADINPSSSFFLCKENYAAEGWLQVRS